MLPFEKVLRSSPASSYRFAEMQSKILPILFLILICLSAPLSLFAQSNASEKTIRAVKIESGVIVLDGKLDEPFWEEIEGSGGFLMQEPIQGGEPTERTIIKIAYDDNNLYIAAILYDSDPSGIKAFQRKRDVSLSTDDRFMWILDTFLDGRNAYFFEINPAGLLGDGLLNAGQGISLNKDWDGIWRPWTHIGDFGWSTEIRIPFRTLNFDPNSDTWGINFQRTVRRKNEELLWTGYLRNQGLWRPQNAGKLTGLKDLSQGLGLEVVPYGKVERSKVENTDEGGFDEQTNVIGGFDVNYSITPGLKASFTLNTDFAETEVDTRQVNLTRFPLFFPERRDFFLEGANIYQFAPRSGVTPYFSRRIGLEGGNPIPVSYGGRVLGRIGKTEIIALQVGTKARDSLPREDFSVIRVRQNFLKESSIGFVYTLRHTQGGEELYFPVQDRHTIGSDLALNTSNFLGDKNLQFQAFYVMHNPSSPFDEETDFMDRSTRGIRLNYPNQPWSAALSYREFGTDYDPQVGFYSRNSFRRVEPQAQYEPLIESSDVIRELGFGFRFEHLMDLDWQKLTQNVGFTPFSIRFETGDEMGYEFTRNYELLIGDFDILGDGTIIIPVGNYTNWVHEIEIETANYRRLTAELGFSSAGFWSGTNRTYESALTVRPYPGINITGEYIHSDVDLAEGAFETNLVRFLTNFDFTPFISLSGNIQYDDLSKRLGLNSRFRYTITPGSDIFLVYNHNWLDNLDRFRTVSAAGVAKATFTYRF